MKIEVAVVDDLKRELSVEIPSQTVEAELGKKLSELGQKAEIKGFRKGKAPVSVLRSKFGEQAKAEVIDELVRQSLVQGVRENNLRMAGRPKMTAFELGDDGTLTYKAELEIFPKVEKVNFDGLELKAKELTVDDKEVDEVVEHYRKRLSELRPLQRAAEATDVVVCDLEKTDDPQKAMEATGFPDSQIDLSNPVTVKEFREQLLGIKAGEEKQIKVVYDDDYSDPVFAGAHLTYNCKIKSVNERVLPQVSDEFAKRTGLGETALEFRLKIRQHLLSEKEAGQQRAHRYQLVDLICGQNEVSIPGGIVDEYLDGMVEDFKNRGEAFNEKELRDRYRPVGIKTMRWDLLWHTLAGQEKIEVLPEDTENWIKGFAAHHGVPPGQARDSLQKAGKNQEVKESILEEKVLNFLMEKATIVPARE